MLVVEMWLSELVRVFGLIVCAAEMAATSRRQGRYRGGSGGRDHDISGWILRLL